MVFRETRVDLTNDYKRVGERARKGVGKFWVNRNTLFSNWDDGILCDEESLYSITPEAMARHLASLLSNEERLVIDICCGVGGNTIRFAEAGKSVIAVDIDATKLLCLAHNSRICGQTERVFPLYGDFASLTPTDFWGDFAFASPPWGGLAYTQIREYSVERHLPIDFARLVAAGLALAPRFAVMLPFRTDIEEAARVIERRCNGRIADVVAYRLNTREISKVIFVV